VLCVLFFSGESDRGGVLEPESLLRLKRKRSKMISRLSVRSIKSKTEETTNTAPSESSKPSIAVGVLVLNSNSKLTGKAVTTFPRTQNDRRNR